MPTEREIEAGSRTLVEAMRELAGIQSDQFDPERITRLMLEAAEESRKPAPRHYGMKADTGKYERPMPVEPVPTKN